MRTRATLALLSLLGLVPAVAWRTAGESWTLEPQSHLWIESKSTVRRFSCKAGAFTVDVDVDAAPDAVSAVLVGVTGASSCT